MSIRYAREVNPICGDCFASVATRCCFVDTVLEFRCIRRLSSQRFHDPTPRFPPRGPGGPVPALRRYYQGATTSCRCSRRTSLPSLGGTTWCVLCFAPTAQERNSGGPGVLAVRRPPRRRVRPVDTAGSPKFLGNPDCFYARFCDSGRTARPPCHDGAAARPPLRERRRLLHWDFRSSIAGLEAGCLRFAG